ncbi:MAG: VOC family protein [marine bacterium B5-7]|nr:MAG: VOC family protein [marine bacterium B5-7]
MKSIATFLMLVGDQHGKAEEAITFYTSSFKDSAIANIERWQAGSNEPEGGIKIAKFILNGVEYMAPENTIDHGFTFTPAISLFVECESAEEIQSAHDARVDRGKSLMPIDNNGFSKRLGWVDDRYGVSWQLNLAD